MTENELSGMVLDSCIEIHKKLGPGLLESAYESILAMELGRRGLSVERQVPLPVVWNGMLVEDSFRADMIVEKKLPLELKAVDRILPVHSKQLLTYLKVSGLKVGLLLNFNTDLMKNGITRVVNNFES